jgi:RNA polymerase sigma factor (sigma-70 family)
MHFSLGLIRRIMGGDRDSQREFIKISSPPVFAVCLSILGNKADAEDAAQEAIFKALTSLDSLQDISKISSWLFAITKNCCKDLLRKKSSRKFEGLHENTGSKSPDFEKQIIMKNALSKLPESLRVPLLLFYFDGMSAKSVAKNLDISEESAFARLSRGRKALRKILCKPMEVKSHAM